MEKSLRETVRKVLLSDVVRMDGGGSSEAWRVMVLDARATRVISSVVGMYDIMEGHVTVVEDLHKVRGEGEHECGEHSLCWGRIILLLRVIVRMFRHPVLESVSVILTRICAPFDTTGRSVFLIVKLSAHCKPFRRAVLLHLVAAKPKTLLCGPRVSRQARQPFREMEGVYLVSPTAESVEAIKRDFSSPAEALYAKAHLFFLERVNPNLLQSIKQCPTLVSRLKTFKVSEMSRSFVVYVCNFFFLFVPLCKRWYWAVGPPFRAP